MSQKHSGYELVPGDNYHTPAWVTEALLSVEIFDAPIWEPAAGAWHMVHPIADFYDSTNVVPTDIDEGADFFSYNTPALGAKSIITNPPYSNGLAEKFVRHALDLMEMVEGKIAMLLPLAWDSAKGRRNLFKDNPAFKAKYTLTKRIRWENLEQKANGPSQNHAWYVWDWNNSNLPLAGYLP